MGKEPGRKLPAGCCRAGIVSRNPSAGVRPPQTAGSAGGHTAVFIDCKRACKRTLALPGYLDLRHFGTAEQNGGIRISAAGRNKLKIKAGAPGSCVLLLRE